MYSSMVDTSLSINLNVNPSQIMDPNEGDLMEELKRMNSENKNLTETVGAISDNYNSLRRHVEKITAQIKNMECEHQHSKLGKRKHEEYDDEVGNKTTKEGRSSVFGVRVRVEPSDKSLIVRDGYQWKKYGHKVTKDNPSPRAYFKCSFAPSCPVKKNVQKSVEDPCIIVATYEGEHNHKKPCESELPLVWNHHSLSTPHATTTNLDDYSDQLCLLVRQMASHLTTNPTFTSTLATIVSNKILDLYHLPS